MRKSLKVLSIVAALTMIPFQLFSVCADEQTIYTGTCGADGDNITWTYDKASETLTFSGTGSLNTYSYDDDCNFTVPWASGKLSDTFAAKTIVIEEGITGLGNTPFAAIWQNNNNVENVINEEEYSVFIPESITDWDGILSIFCGTNVYVKYGSDFYYWLRDPSNRGIYRIHGNGIAENERCATNGTLECGLSWDFDYETSTLTISGTDALNSSNDRYYLTTALSTIWNAASKVIVDADFVVPEDPSPEELSEQKQAYAQDYYIKSIMWLNCGCAYRRTIYYYKDSSFEEKYQDFVMNYPEYVQMSWGSKAECIDGETPVTTTESTIEVETTTTTTTTKSTAKTGDVNLDSSVDLIDAVYLNKYVANVVDLTDTQLQDADCNGDGNVTDQDTAILMKYLVCSISELPYTE